MLKIVSTKKTPIFGTVYVEDIRFLETGGYEIVLVPRLVIVGYK